MDFGTWSSGRIRAWGACDRRVRFSPSRPNNQSNGSVAQWIEQFRPKEKVVSSTLAGITILQIPYMKTMIVNNTLLAKVKKILRPSEIKRIVLFLIIGGGLTIGTFVLWSILLFLYNEYSDTTATPLVNSITYFISGFLLFSVSFFLHRKITFKEVIPDKESFVRSIIIFYLTYSTTTLISSILIYLSLSQEAELLNNNLYYEIFKIGATVFNAGINFLVQRIIMYNKSQTT